MKYPYRFFRNTAYFFVNNDTLYQDFHANDYMYEEGKFDDLFGT